MIIEKYFLSNFIIKEWDTSTINFDILGAEERIQKINTITRNYRESNLIIDKVGAIYFSVSSRFKTSRVAPKKIIYYLQILAEDIDFYHSQNLVHGDIKYSNIIYGNYHINLIDWEPVLEYSKQGSTIFRSTMPFISSSDLLNKKITKKTDRISFYFLCARLLKQIKYINREQVLAIEEKIVDLNCKRIVFLLSKL